MTGDRPDTCDYLDYIEEPDSRFRIRDISKCDYFEAETKSFGPVVFLYDRLTGDL